MKDFRVDITLKARHEDHWVKIDIINNLTPDEVVELLLMKYCAKPNTIMLKADKAWKEAEKDVERWLNIGSR